MTREEEKAYAIQLMEDAALDMMNIGLTEEQANRVVLAIEDGAISNVYLDTEMD